MSRAGTSDAIVVRPANNVYTVLVIVAFVVEIVGFVALYMRSEALGISLFK